MELHSRNDVTILNIMRSFFEQTLRFVTYSSREFIMCLQHRYSTLTGEGGVHYYYLPTSHNIPYNSRLLFELRVTIKKSIDILRKGKLLRSFFIHGLFKQPWSHGTLHGFCGEMQAISGRLW